MQAASLRNQDLSCWRARIIGVHRLTRRQGGGALRHFGRPSRNVQLRRLGVGEQATS